MPFDAGQSVSSAEPVDVMSMAPSIGISNTIFYESAIYSPPLGLTALLSRRSTNILLIHVSAKTASDLVITQLPNSVIVASPSL